MTQTIGSGSVAVAFGGGEQPGLIVANGGELLANGGLDVGTTVNSGGLEDVANGGRSIGTVLNGGRQVVTTDPGPGGLGDSPAPGFSPGWP